MPRQARIDYPGLMHHIMVRGINKRKIFEHKSDYEQFMIRLEKTMGDSNIYAWAFMPNHIHLLIKTANKRLSQIMSQLLTGYAIYFNRKYKRVGYLFQNRYKSIACHNDQYFTTLVCYIHLNPLKANIVKDLNELATYPWSGHGVLMGRRSCNFQEIRTVYNQYGRKVKSAISAYLNHLSEGYQKNISKDQQYIEKNMNDLYGNLVENNENVEENYKPKISNYSITSMDSIRTVMDELILKIASQYDIHPQELFSKSRKSEVTRAREDCIYYGMNHLGFSGTDVSKVFKRSKSSISRAYYRRKKRIMKMIK